MKIRRLHRKVWVGWNNWFAFQFINQFEFSFGVRIEPTRPLLDIFLGPLTIAFGTHPILTDPRMNQYHAGRGFVNIDRAAADLGIYNARIL